MTSTAKAAAALGRQLEPAERDTMAQAMAGNNVSLAYIPAYWLSTAFLLERWGRRRLRFPFYTPTGINPEVFPNERLAYIRGPPAVWAWNATRLACYAFVSKLSIAPIVAGMVTYSTYQIFTHDKNLAAFHQAMRKLSVTDARMLENQLGSRIASIYGGSEDLSMRDASEPLFGQASDADPTPASENSWAQRRSRWAPQRQSAHEQEMSSQGTSSAAPVASDSTSWDTGSDPLDDASPVAPAAREQTATNSSTPRAGGSTWERIRQGAQSQRQGGGSNGTQSWEQRRFQASRGADQASQAGDSYTYSKEEEESNYAKEQAQKQFDAMLERERKGAERDGSGRF